MVEKLDGISPKPSEGLSEWDVFEQASGQSSKPTSDDDALPEV